VAEVVMMVVDIKEDMMTGEVVVVVVTMMTEADIIEMTDEAEEDMEVVVDTEEIGEEERTIIMEVVEA